MAGGLVASIIAFAVGAILILQLLSDPISTASIFTPSV